MVGIDWDSIGIIGIVMIAFIYALAKGYLYLPPTVEQWKSQIEQWKHRWEEMRDDRDYWRDRAERAQVNAETAVKIQSTCLEGDHNGN